MADKIDSLLGMLDDEDVYFDGQVLSFARKLMEARGNNPDAAVKLAGALARAGLYVCCDKNPEAYYHFLARALQTVLDEMDGAESWARSVLEK